MILFLVLGLYEWRRNREFDGAVRAFQEDRLKEGQELILHYLKTRPNHAAAHLLAARMDRLLGNYPGAENHLNECKRLEGMTGDLQLEWLLLRAVRGEYAEVEKSLKQLLADQHPRSDLILETLVHCQLGVLRYNSAMDYLQTWLKKEPDSVRALHLRAFVWERLGSRDQSQDDYARALELAPGNRQVRLALLGLLLTDKNIQEAAEHLALLKNNPHHEPAELMVLARFELLQGNQEEAQKYLDELLAKKPDHAEALFEQGMLATDPVQAEAFFRKALTGNENFLQARYQLYSLLLRENRKKEAEAEKAKYLAFREDWERLPNLLAEADRLASPDLLADAAAILVRGGDNQGAQLLFRALHLNPRHKRSHELLAVFFEKTNQPDKAAHHRERAAVKSP